MIMSRLDEPGGPQGQNVNEVPTGVPDVRISLPENDLSRIEDMCDDQVGVVNLIVRLANPVR